MFHNALKEVPKSGEVWCEGARICIAQKNFPGMNSIFTLAFSNFQKYHRRNSNVCLPYRKYDFFSFFSSLEKYHPFLSFSSFLFIYFLIFVILFVCIFYFIFKCIVFVLILFFLYADARRFLDFAIQFTPQYGDSFIEYLLLELLEHGPQRVDTRKLVCIYGCFVCMLGVRACVWCMRACMRVCVCVRACMRVCARACLLAACEHACVYLFVSVYVCISFPSFFPNTTSPF